MMKKYIKPNMLVESLEAEQMMALSIIKNGTADDSDVLVNEENDDIRTTTNSIWDKEW